MNESERERAALKRGQRISRISVAVLTFVFLLEVTVGMISGSIALIADGIESAGDAFISLIVWFGLRLSQREPDERFHYGYTKAETFSALIAAFVVLIMGAVILYESYLRLIDPVMVSYPLLAIIVAFLAGSASMVLAFFKLKIAQEAKSQAISIDAKNQLKDGLTSFLVVVGIAASYLGFYQMDAIAGVVIAIFIFTVSYVTLKESAYVLMDACVKCDGIGQIWTIAESVKGVKKVRDLRLRSIGPFVTGEMEIAVDGETSIQELKKITDDIEARVKAQFPYISRLTIEVEPHEAA